VSTPQIAPPGREATIADVETLVSLVREFCAHFDYQFSESRTRAALYELLTDRLLGRVFLVEHDDAALGYIALTFSFSLEFGGRTAFIDEFFIQAAGRGRGLGQRVLDFVAERSRAAGINAILLEAEDTNPRASALYKKAGYECFGRRLLTKSLNPEAGYGVASLRITKSE
jgi:ribosomal protein S18 acetylase RimI-like enzyme